MDDLQVDDRGMINVCESCGQKNRVAFDRLNTAVRCGKCHTEFSATSRPREIQASADFDQLVSQATIPVVVDFWAPWCGPCRMVAPELAKVATRSAGRFLVVKVNTDVLTDLGERFAIRSIPTMAVIVGGREVARASGARPAADIEAFVSQAAATQGR
jgi:thioredoxin 2